jgi:two-component system, LuxR family, sensor kinase FixL
MTVDALEQFNGSLANQILETVDTLIVVLDRGGAIAYFNRACQRLTGYSAAEAIGRKVWNFLIIDAEIDAVRCAFEELTANNTPSYFSNYWKAKSGEHRLIKWTNNTLTHEDGSLAYILGTGVDITESKSQEAALTESKSFLRSIIDTSPVAIITTGENGLIRSFSRQAEAVFGYTEDEVLGQNLNILMPEPDSSRHDQYINRYLETGQRRIMGQARSVTALKRNGTRFPAVLHVNEFHDGERIFVGFIEDITEKKMMEQRFDDVKNQLQHVGRIGAMGEIATSIAHELNQPLTAAASLAGAVSLTLRKSDFPQRDNAISHLDDTVSEIRRASAIIRQMRDFMRKRKTARSLHNVNRVVEEASAIALIGAESEGVHVTNNLAPDTGEASIDRIQIQQVVINLIRNAIDAMIDSKEKHLTISTTRINGFIEVKVSDTGHGVPDDVKKRLFEPFFTSKDEGMGIGLSISKSIIDAHQGEIFSMDKDSPGSVFIFRVPAGPHDAVEGND